MTIRLVPILMALYFVNYLDRTNLGIAKAELSADLQLSATMFGLASGIFFIGYVLVEVPSNLALVRSVPGAGWPGSLSPGHRRGRHRLRPQRRMVAGPAIPARRSRGLPVPGRHPLPRPLVPGRLPGPDRRGVHACWSRIASAIGTPLAAWLIEAGHGAFGLSGWRVMMICVGSPAVILGVICWFYLTDRPADAHWLPADERRWLIDTLAAEEHEVARTFHFPLRRALTSPRVWALAVVYFGVAYGLYALAFFLPSIIAGFKKTFGVQLSIIEVG